MIGEKDFLKIPLCIDLDGTLWKGDCLWLTVRLFLKKNPWDFWKIFVWWRKDRTALKHHVLNKVIFDPSKIEYFQNMLDYLNTLKTQGAKLYLVTGSDQGIADQVAAYLGIFEKAFGSTIGLNLVAKEKAKLLNKLFGKKHYIYFGNEWKDRFVWQDAAAAVAVNVSAKTKQWLKNSGLPVQYFKCF